KSAFRKFIASRFTPSRWKRAELSRNRLRRKGNHGRETLQDVARFRSLDKLREKSCANQYEYDQQGATRLPADKPNPPQRQRNIDDIHQSEPERDDEIGAVLIPFLVQRENVPGNRQQLDPRREPDRQRPQEQNFEISAQRMAPGALGGNRAELIVQCGIH